MRTTVNIDDDLLSEVRERAGEEGTSFRKVLNHVLRLGLEQARAAKPGKPFRVKSHAMGDPSRYNLDKALLVADALEDEEVLRKLSVRK